MCSYSMIEPTIRSQTPLFLDPCNLSYSPMVQLDSTSCSRPVIKWVIEEGACSRQARAVKCDRNTFCPVGLTRLIIGTGLGALIVIHREMHDLRTPWLKTDATHYWRLFGLAG